MKFETQGVLAGAYAAKNPKSYLTHLTEMGDAGGTIRVMCKGVKLASIMDDDCAFTDEQKVARPTCEVCAKVWDRLAR